MMGNLGLAFETAAFATVRLSDVFDLKVCVSACKMTQ